MRIFATALTTLVLAGCALAQQTHFVPAAFVVPTQPVRGFHLAEQVSGVHRYWYWEVDDSVRVPFETYNYLPNRMMVVDQGFSPASLIWDFAGKHKLIPALDLTVIQVKPGEKKIPATKPDAEFGTFESRRGVLWAKATRSLMAALHY